MDQMLEDAHGDEESVQTSDSEEYVTGPMATPPEMPIVANEDDGVDEDEDEDEDEYELEEQEVDEEEQEEEQTEEQGEQPRQQSLAMLAKQELSGDRPASSTYLLSRSIPQPKWTINELRGATMPLAFMRQRLFDVKEPVELKSDEFDYYFPFIDNVWVRQHKSRPSEPTPGSTKGTVRTDYYACRLQRPTYQPRKPPAGADGKPLRKKKTREGGTCKVRLRAIHYEGGVHAVTVSRVGGHEHSHQLEDMDKMKRNSVVMDLARSEVMKGYSPASVFNVLNADPAKLAILGGKFLTRSDVRNSSQAWRASFDGELRNHPGYAASDPIGPTLAPKSAPSLPTTPMPQPGPAPPTALPADTLHFSPALHPFLEPFLPRYDLVIPPGQLPHVTLTYATSLDSFLALAPGVQTHLSGPITKAMTHYLRSRHDAILVGVGTAAVDNPTLNCRIAGAGGYGGLGWALHPRPVILDPLARWKLDPQKTAVLRAASEGRGRAPWVIVAPGFHLDPQRNEMLKFFGGKYLGLADIDSRYPLRPRLKWEAVLRALAAEGIRSVMIEGGGSVINDLLSVENRFMVSSVVLTVAPTYMGMGGVVVCPNRNFGPDGKPRPVVRFRDVRWCPMGEDVVMAGRFAPETPPSAMLQRALVEQRGATTPQGGNIGGQTGGSNGSSALIRGDNDDHDDEDTNGRSRESLGPPAKRQRRMDSQQSQMRTVAEQEFGQTAEVISNTFLGTA